MTIPADYNGTIDLNGKTINATGAKGLIVTGNSNITIKNGNIISTNMGIRMEGSNSTLNISNDVEVNSGDCCIFVPQNSENVTVNITGGNLTSTSNSNAAICTNGLLSNSTMNISGGSIVSENSVAVYFPSNGNLTITGGEITGKESAVEYRGTGLLKITGGTFTSTGSPFTQQANGNGSTTVAAAVTVVPHAGRTSNVEFTGGTFKATNNDCYAYWIGTETANGTTLTTGSIGTVSISGVTTTGQIYSCK